jgi:hypothetical protein
MHSLEKIVEMNKSAKSEPVDEVTLGQIQEWKARKESHVTRAMVEYWLGNTYVDKEIVKDIVDIANGDYKVETLRSDINATWEQTKK